MKKTALVVSGGGAKGAFAVGAIEVLKQKGISIDFVTGTSTGALIAPLVSVGEIEKLAEIYTSVRTKNIIRYNWRKFFWNSLYDTKPLKKLITKIMKDRFEALQNSSIPIYLCSVGLNTGDVKYYTQNECDHPNVYSWGDFDGFVNAVLASTNQPFIMPAIKIGDELHVDGGVREIVPLKLAYELGANTIIVIANSTRNHPDEDIKNRIDKIGMRALDLMSTEVLENDLTLKVLSNDCSIITIRPDAPLTDNSLEFVPEKMEEMRQKGIKKALEIF
jgi:NTE family protein